MVAIGRFLSLLLCLLSDNAAAVAAEGGSALVSREELQGMRIAQLRSFLQARGEECRGCVEKADFVERAYAVRERAPSTDAGDGGAKPSVPPEVEQMQQQHQQEEEQGQASSRPEEVPLSEEEEARRRKVRRIQLENFIKNMKVTGGFGGANVYTADDLRGMSPEDMQRQFGGGKSKPTPGDGKDKARPRSSGGAGGPKPSPGGSSSSSSAGGSGSSGGGRPRKASPPPRRDPEDVLEL